MNREYEILIVLRPRMAEADLKAFLDNFQSWISNNEGDITLLNELGLRDLAFPMAKQTKGFYIQCQFNATGKTLAELENRLGVSEDVLRYMNVTMDSIRDTSRGEKVAAKKG